jgi:hypothetical protein
MGKMYSILLFAGLAVSSLAKAAVPDAWATPPTLVERATSVDWGNVGGVVLGIAGLGLLGLVAFTVGTGWILLLKSMLRRLRAQ